MSFDNLPKIPPFKIYDIETGNEVDVSAIEELQNEAITGDLFISEDGELLADGICGGEMIALPRDRYIVQIGSNLYKW